MKNREVFYIITNGERKYLAIDPKIISYGKKSIILLIS